MARPITALLILIYCLFCASITNTQAAPMNDQAAQADKLFAQGNYVAALRTYEQATAHATYPEAFAALNYNIGVCHYKLRNYPKALLHFKRALRYQPDLEAARHNMEVVSEKLNVSSTHENDNIILSWLRTIIYGGRSSNAGLLALVMLLAALTLFLAAYMLRRPRLSPRLRLLAIVCLVVFACAETCAWLRYQAMPPLSTVETAPTEGDEGVVLHTTEGYTAPSLTSKTQQAITEGTLIKLSAILHLSAGGTTKEEWVRIKLPDGKETYITTDHIGWI